MPKTRPITATRQAIFDRHNLEPKQAEKLHWEIETKFEKCLELYEVPNTGDREADGNKVLEAYFESQKRYDQLIANRVKAAELYADKFQRTFGVRLRSLYSFHLGLDVIGLNTLVNPDTQENLSQAIQRRWGDDALKMVQDLIGQPTDKV